MGWCHEFGGDIDPSCQHPMRAEATRCACDVCGTSCSGVYDGCGDVWRRGPRDIALLPARPARVDVLAPPQGRARHDDALPADLVLSPSPVVADGEATPPSRVDVVAQAAPELGASFDGAHAEHDRDDRGDRAQLEEELAGAREAERLVRAERDEARRRLEHEAANARELATAIELGALRQHRMGDLARAVNHLTQRVSDVIVVANASGPGNAAVLAPSGAHDAVSAVGPAAEALLEALDSLEVASARTSALAADLEKVEERVVDVADAVRRRIAIARARGLLLSRSDRRTAATT